MCISNCYLLFFYISKTVTVLWNHVCNILLILTCDVSEGSLTQMCWGSPRGFCLYNSSVFILLGRNSELKQTWYKYLLSNLSWKDWATLLNGSTNQNVLKKASMYLPSTQTGKLEVGKQVYWSESMSTLWWYKIQWEVDQVCGWMFFSNDCRKHGWCDSSPKMKQSLSFCTVIVFLCLMKFCLVFGQQIFSVYTP